MRRSIRRILLFWYGLILLAVIGGFGVALYQRQVATLYDEVDAEVRAHAEAVAGSLEWDPIEGFELEMTEEYAGRFLQEGRDVPYILIWDPDGKQLYRSRSAPERPRPEGPGFRASSRIREMVAVGPRGALVLVGRGAHKIREDLRHFRNTVAGIGGAAFLLALLGGWFLVSRVLRPIDRMTATAASISASNLSERIDIGRTESELGRLAKTLNAAFDRLQEAFDRQTRFTADASHELRTPLSILISNIEVALRGDPPPGEYRDTLETCLRAARRMKGVVEGLLTLARTDAGDLALQREPVDLKAAVAETAGMLQPLAEERRVQVRLATDPVEVSGDRERLREVAANVISNAIRYNREGGSVEVALRRDGNEAVLAVRDTGLGIPEKDVPRIFERFYRVDKARSREMGGSGLGLAITKWIVQAHGGTISVTSREGEGTEITIRLPKAE